MPKNCWPGWLFSASCAVSISKARAVNALLIEISMLPIQAPSIRTWLTRFPPASTTAMFIGWPISRALASAAVITRRASLGEITTLSSNTRMLWQYWDALAMLSRLGHQPVRVDHEFVRHPGIEITVALGRSVEADHLDVDDLADREPAPQDRLHQLSVVLQHRGLPGVQTVGLCPAEAKAEAQHSLLRSIFLCTGVIGHVEPGNADRTG